MADDDDDDYLSDKFLSLPDPSLEVKKKSYAYRRLKAQTNASSANSQSKDKLREIQTATLKSSLSKPIASTNVGAKMLAKMGFNPTAGLGLGPSNNGIAEPIAINPIRRGKTGLGAMTKGDELELKAREMEKMKKRKEVEVLKEWELVVREKVESREIEFDVRQARKTIYHLDSLKELTYHTHFWPLSLQFESTSLPHSISDENSRNLDEKSLEQLYVEHVENEDGERMMFAHDPRDFDREMLKRKGEHLDDGKERQEVEKKRKISVDDKNDKDNGEAEGSAKELTESEKFEMLDPSAQLSLLLHYLRDTHYYCLYCGCTFESKEEMEGEGGCPGIGKNVHE